MIQRLEKCTPNQPCLVTNRSDLPVLDFGVFAQGLDPKLVISVPVLTEAAALIGFATLEDAEALREERDAALARARELEEELSRSEAVLDAVDVIESKGFRARRKPGKPAKPKTPEGAVA